MSCFTNIGAKIEMKPDNVWYVQSEFWYLFELIVLKYTIIRYWLHFSQAM